eukprot:GHVN01005135.1.p1 GENE.GHVN01005135.1~~GHVN01005135.1.p1  ORF type:complete len:348 (+),score=31.13 GHVN01005135.1:1231-2274(+)
MRRHLFSHGVVLLASLVTIGVIANDSHFSLIGSYVESLLSPNLEFTPNLAGTIYMTHEPPSINQAEEALVYLEFAEHVHRPRGIGAPTGWTIAETIQDQSIGYHVAVYTKDDRAIISFRGSEFGTADWITNGIMAEGEFPDQYRQAVRDARMFVMKYSNFNIHFTGYSLGGGLASAATITTGVPATVFNSSGLGDSAFAYVKEYLGSIGAADSVWMENALSITNFNLEGEISDLDYQQDADTVGITSRLYGDVYYLSADRFNVPDFLDNGVARHTTTPLKEELQFLSNPIYRVNTSDLDSVGNQLDPRRSRMYIDRTDDSIDLFVWFARYMVNSFPSLRADLRTNLR